MDDEFTLCKKEGDTVPPEYTPMQAGGLCKTKRSTQIYVPIMTLRRGDWDWQLGLRQHLNTVETILCFSLSLLQHTIDDDLYDFPDCYHFFESFFATGNGNGNGNGMDVALGLLLCN
jgi:hypothetical protein